MQSLEELAVLAVPNPGEIARQFFSPWQTVRMALEEREYSEMREEYRKEHEIQVCNEGIKVCG